MGERIATVEDVVARALPDPSFWHGRRVLLTGHTGFKGAWTALWLKRMGAVVTGFALPPATDPSLWREVGDGVLASDIIGDLADRRAVADAVAAARPTIVLHMAAQALVRASYRDPVETFASNAMGTVHLLDALRGQEQVEAVLIVTTDKVYRNEDRGRDFVESDPLGGHDPYSASKAAAELVTASYANSFFAATDGARIATARAGNVIGGGDWSEDRLVPDVWRAARAGNPVALRHPQSTRPWQHVLEPVGGYLLYLEALAARRDVPRALNFGPDPAENATVAQVAEAMGDALGAGRMWIPDAAPSPPEMRLLSLDPTAARTALGWNPRLGSADAVRWSAQWYAARDRGEPSMALCQSQLDRYEALA